MQLLQCLPVCSSLDLLPRGPKALLDYSSQKVSFDLPINMPGWGIRMREKWCGRKRLYLCALLEVALISLQ